MRKIVTWEGVHVSAPRSQMVSNDVCWVVTLFCIVPPLRHWITKKKKRTVHYPNISSAIRRLPHTEDLPVPFDRYPTLKTFLFHSTGTQHWRPPCSTRPVPNTEDLPVPFDRYPTLKTSLFHSTGTQHWRPPCSTRPVPNTEDLPVPFDRYPTLKTSLFHSTGIQHWRPPCSSTTAAEYFRFRWWAYRKLGEDTSTFNIYGCRFHCWSSI